MSPRWRSRSSTANTEVVHRALHTGDPRSNIKCHQRLRGASVPAATCSPDARPRRKASKNCRAFQSPPLPLTMLASRNCIVRSERTRGHRFPERSPAPLNDGSEAWMAPSDIAPAQMREGRQRSGNIYRFFVPHLDDDVHQLAHRTRQLPLGRG